MTHELTALTLAALIQIATLVVVVIPANLQLGFAKTLSPRDPDRLGKPLMEQVGPKTARAYRAYSNHFESLALFAIACLVITLAEKSSPLTAICAYTYVVARVVYIPAYIFGLVPWRTFIWFAAFAAAALMLIMALL